MTAGLRHIVKQIAPPVLVHLWQRHGTSYGYFGDYRSWEDAVADSTGYDLDSILEKVRDALLLVKEGKAAGERDSVLFDKPPYSWPLLAGLLWIASQRGNRLSVADFGGSLGSSYFQNRAFLSHLPELRWGVVEQENFIRCGRTHFEDEHLIFLETLQECSHKLSPDLLLLGSVIQYLERPYEFLEEALALRFPFIIFDRTPFIGGERDRLTVQKVPPAVYEASYPSWFFGIDRFRRFMARDYELVADFETADRANIPGTSFNGFIFRRRDSGDTR